MKIEKLSFNYTNHRNETSKRTVIPEHVWYGTTQWHKDEQWFLKAFDSDKEQNRHFAIEDIKAPDFIKLGLVNMIALTRVREKSELKKQTSLEAPLRTIRVNRKVDEINVQLEVKRAIPIIRK